DSQNGKKTKENYSNQLFFVSDTKVPENLQEISLLINTKNIYMSIDRDYLSKEVVQTNWDQGDNQLSDLLKVIRFLANHHSLVGADVCGDIVLDYQTLHQFTMQSTLQQSIEVNRKIFEPLTNF